MNRKHFHPYATLGNDGQIYFNASASLAEASVWINRPSDTEIREMLTAIRNALQLSVPALAAVSDSGCPEGYPSPVDERGKATLGSRKKAHLAAPRKLAGTGNSHQARGMVELANRNTVSVERQQCFTPNRRLVRDLKGLNVLLVQPGNTESSL